MWAVRVAACCLLWSLVGVLMLAASTAYHVDTPIARRIARNNLADFISGQMQGTLELGRIETIERDRIVARNAAVLDPSGRRVLKAEHVLVIPDLRAAMRGMLRFRLGSLKHGEVELIEPDPGELPTVIQAFEPAGPETEDDDEPGLHALVDELRISDFELHGTILGLEGLRVRDVTARGRLEVDGPLVIDLHQGRGKVVEPFPFVGHMSGLEGQIHTDPRKGVRLAVRGRRDGEQAGVELTYALPDGAGLDETEELDLRIQADPMQASTLHDVGYEWAALLRGNFRGSLRLHGPPEDLRLEADLDTEGGPVKVTGHLPSEGTVTIEARTQGVKLHKLVRDSPELEVAGRATMHVEDTDASNPKVELALDPFLYDRWAVPSLRIDGVLEEEAFRIERLRAPYAGGNVSARGRVHFDGSMDVRVHANIPAIQRDRNIRRLMPDAKGSLKADVRLGLGPEAGERVHFDGEITLEDFRYGPLYAAWLRARGHVRGDPDRPDVDLELAGEGVRMADYPLGQADVQLTGGPRNYVARGRFHALGARKVEFDAQVQAGRDRYVLDAERVELSVRDLVWRGAVKNLVYEPDHGVSVDNMRLASGSQRLEADGAIRFQGPDELDAQLQDFDLSGLQVLVPKQAPDIEGRVDSHVRLRGDVDRPKLLLQGALRGGSAMGLDGIDLVYALDYAGGEVTLDTQVAIAGRGSVGIFTKGIVDPEQKLLEALKSGVYETELSVDKLDVGVLRTLAGNPRPEVTGNLSGNVQASGPIQAPSFEGELHAPDLRMPGWPQLGMHTRFSYETGVLNGRLVAEDEQGRVGETEISLLIDLVNLVNHPEQGIASLHTAPWRISMRLPDRRLGALPEPLATRIPTSLHPMRASVNATFQGGAFRTRGDVFAALKWDEGLKRHPCGTDARPRATLNAHLREGSTSFEGTVMVGDRAAVHLNGSAPTPIEDWLQQAAVPKPPATRLSMELARMDLGAVPGVCEVVAGPASGTARIAGVFSDDPSVRLELRSPGLRLRRFRGGPQGEKVLAVETQSAQAEIRAHVDSERAETNVALEWQGGGITHIAARLPTRWASDSALPGVGGNGELDADVRLDRTPVAPILTQISGIVDVEGVLTGNLRVEGPVTSPTTRGSVHLQHGYLEVVPLGQQLSDFSGQFVFHDEWLEVKGLTARDRNGSLELNGSVELDGILPDSLRLAMRSRKFPVRQEGSILARLTGQAVIDAVLGSGRTDATLTVRDLTVRMPDQPPRSLQPLDRHPDIKVVGQKRATTDTGEPYVLNLKVQATEPFSVRRRDFSARVVTETEAVYRDPNLYVHGYLEIERGFFEVFGKKFDVRNARMNFRGEPEINPDVNLVAVHELRNRPGETVSVTVTGRLTRPEVQFATSVQRCSQRGQIIALLVSGRCAGERGQGANEQEAGQQAANFLAGITAGVLTLQAREEFGDILPVIVIESGDEGFRSAKVRAGFQADQFIPEFLRPAVQGAYVEGFFTAGTTEGGTRTTSQGRDHGFSLELQFPHNIVGTGTFSPPDSWSVDLTWEP